MSKSCSGPRRACLANLCATTAVTPEMPSCMKGTRSLATCIMRPSICRARVVRMARLTAAW